MRHIILAIALGMFLIGCNNNSVKNVALIEKYIESVETQDYDTMESPYDGPSPR